MNPWVRVRQFVIASALFWTLGLSPLFAQRAALVDGVVANRAAEQAGTHEDKLHVYTPRVMSRWRDVLWRKHYS